MQTSVPSVTVNPGQSITQDIIMQPAASDNGSTCLSEHLLTSHCCGQQLIALRIFRDRVMKHTHLGKYLVDLYYDIGDDIWHVLQTRPALKRKCLCLLADVQPIVEAALAGRHPSVPVTLLNKASAFLFDVEISSPPALRTKVHHLRSKLRTIDYQKLFAIRQELQ
jgi:hypothetical protein